MPRGGDYAARVRAARCYADMSKPDFGEALGISARQVGRLEAGERNPDPDMREKIAAVCEVPRVFMEMGFLPMEQPISGAEQRILEAEESLARRVAALEELIKIDELREMLDLTRRAKALLDDADSKTQADNETQRGADAKTEGPRSRSAKTRRSADGGVA